MHCKLSLSVLDYFLFTFPGCLLYQMATLEPPFTGSNMLTLAKKIVEGEFIEIAGPDSADGSGYSNLVSETVHS